MIKAKYTVVLKTLLDNPDSKSAIDKALSTYPLYNPPKKYELIPVREEINKRLLNRYKYREIGFETVGRFIDELEITMCEIMPHYNSLFKTIEIMEELPSPFDNVDVIETFEQETTNHTTTDGTNTSNSSNHTADTTETNTSNTATNETTATDQNTTTTNMADTAKTVKSETPQGRIDITANNIDSVPYADNVQWNKNTSNSTAAATGENSTQSTTTDTGTNITTGTNDTTIDTEQNSNIESNATGTQKHTYTKKGNQGVNTYAHDMNEYRTALIDVVNQIVNDRRLAELFMLIY